MKQKIFKEKRKKESLIPLWNLQANVQALGTTKSTIKVVCKPHEKIGTLPSSTVTFPLKKYFPCPLERATPKLCREIKQTLKSVRQTTADIQSYFHF